MRFDTSQAPLLRNTTIDIRYFSYYVISVRLTWDERKRRSNLDKHGLDFAHVADFDFASALVAEDTRGRADPKFRYAERRFIAIGLMRGTLVVLVYTPTKTGRRIVSLRRAEESEGKLWLGK